jgi:hypothetical protein
MQVKCGVILVLQKIIVNTLINIKLSNHHTCIIFFEIFFKKKVH